MNSTSNIKREKNVISAFKSPKSCFNQPSCKAKMLAVNLFSANHKYSHRDGGDAGGVTGEKAAKPVTAVQDCVVTFGNVKPLDIK